MSNKHLHYNERDSVFNITTYSGYASSSTTSDMSTYTQTQLDSNRPADPLYVGYMEDLTKLGVAVDEVRTSYGILLVALLTQL